jgi:hypothetical protein
MIKFKSFIKYLLVFLIMFSGFGGRVYAQRPTPIENTWGYIRGLFDTLATVHTLSIEIQIDNQFDRESFRQIIEGEDLDSIYIRSQENGGLGVQSLNSKKEIEAILSPTSSEDPFATVYNSGVIARSPQSVQFSILETRLSDFIKIKKGIKGVISINTLEPRTGKLGVLRAYTLMFIVNIIPSFFIEGRNNIFFDKLNDEEKRFAKRAVGLAERTMRERLYSGIEVISLEPDNEFKLKNPNKNCVEPGEFSNLDSNEPIKNAYKAKVAVYKEFGRLDYVKEVKCQGA